MGKTDSTNAKHTVGLLAEFKNPAALLGAARKVRRAGYRDFDCHSPFPIHGLDEAMGMKRSPLGYVVFFAGLLGAAGGLLLQWWASAVEYPLIISGKPYFAYPAFVPVTFELCILFGAFGAVLGMLHLNRLPMFFHHVFYCDKFEKVTDDGFFISVEASDPKFDTEQSQAFFENLDCDYVELIREE
ncbi:MAG: DUF3341 domain-containing protein [bacterium]